MLGLSTTAGGPGVNGMPIICNGFKDDEFIETVALHNQAGPEHRPRRGEVDGTGTDSEARQDVRRHPRSACA